ncbi:MAG TPA: isoleucine--tRNA ligase [Candidatus Paceibacterota bacterium]|nr:isoleucine--tRNA ligase [Candidatus Paceibacterota bacterium]
MYDFKEIEQEAAKLVKKEEITRAVLNDSKKKKLFSFLEGPPTANAPPGLHHLEVRTYKDIINKFRYMQGYNVPRKAGWDCHGLPVEVQIEKKLGLKNKKDILNYGEAKFIKDCRESVFSYIDAWNKSTERLNYWIDLKNPYVTLENDYIESVWWSLKQLYEKKLLYEAHKVVPFCPRCETPLSSHEVAQGYKKVKEDSVIVKMRLKSGENLLVWTTTPWTLPSNLAVAVNPNIDYVYVEEREVFILAKEQANKLFEEPNITKTIKGKELVGKEYYPLFDYYKDLAGAFKIIGGDFVTTEDGTGIVHMAPAFGEVDYDACKQAGIPFVQPVDETGCFTDEVPDYKGRFIKDTDKEIIQRLEREDKLFQVIPYEHDYPFCWRCNSPLMYYAIQSWFINVTKYKKRLIELNDKINWTPKYIKEGRFGEWLENVKDWALSRKKFWGTPLPVWKCTNERCNCEEIIGSIDELKKRSNKKITEKEIDLHKPWIDNIKFNCKNCGSEMERVSDVIDCWYDSGSATFAQFHYPFENKKEFEKRVPYDFISEAIDQTRGWFYTLHVLSTILFDNVAYKNVICAGHVVDEKGEKMSKSKGNIINPDKMMDEVGIDAVRLQFCTVDIGASKKFGIDIIKKEILPFLNVLWNINQFYSQLNNSEKVEVRIEDKWILSRLNSVIKESTESLENYQIERALNLLIEFIVDDFSKKYIKMIREREDKNVQRVVKEVLEAVVKMLAPYAPNITEVIYHKISEKKQSVHLSKWPKIDSKKINKKLEEEFESALKVIEAGLAERDKLKIGLKWPLASVTVETNKKISKKVKEIIKNQLQVKKVIICNSNKEEISVNFDITVTPELEAEGYVRNISRAIQSLRKKIGLIKSDKIDLYLLTNNKILELIKIEKDFLMNRTNSVKILFSENKMDEPGFSNDKIEIKGYEIIFGIKKVE